MLKYETDSTLQGLEATGHGVSELYLLIRHSRECRYLDNRTACGWFGEERVAQEMVLGIGGVAPSRSWREPDVYHFNEGHAVLAGLDSSDKKAGCWS